MMDWLIMGIKSLTEYNESATERNHINGIENFWGLCKVRLSKYKGIHKHKFYSHFKEGEPSLRARRSQFRYCYCNKNL